MQQPRKTPLPTAKSAGFTLVEVIIVIGIFAILSSISYTALTQYISVTEKLEEKEAFQQRLQSLFTIMEKDFRYIVNRSVRDEFGDGEPAFELDKSSDISGEKVRFTTIYPDYQNPVTGKSVRVAWSHDEEGIYRNFWPHLDRTDSTEVTTIKIIEGVEHFDIELYQWDVVYGLQTTDTFGGDFQIPFGIKVILEMENGVEYYRLFDIANGS